MEELNALPLSDISPEQLDELTNLLWMDPGVRITMPDHEWLLDQQARISRLHKSNRRSMKIRDRLSARLESLTSQHVDDGMPSACLCPFHYDLNRKLIRRLMLLIVSECTERIQLLRTWRARIAFPKTVVAWLDRIDAVSGLWFGRDAFNATFGYERASPTDLIVRSKCEACIMSVIGGRPQVLADLRANLILRRDRHIDRGRSGPRLLRLVESWTDQFDADCRRVILTGSGLMSEELNNLLSVITSLREECPGSSRLPAALPETNSRRQTGAHEEGNRQGRGHHQRASHEQHPRQSHGNETSHGDKHSDLSRDSSYQTTSKQGSDQDWMEEDENCQASIWMDCQMQQQGLTAEQRRKIFEQDMHPAFSDYAQNVAGKSMGNRSHSISMVRQKSHRAPASGDQRAVSERHADNVSTFSNKSAVPPPLSLTRQTQQVPSPPRSTYGSSAVGTVWEPVSVFSPPATVVEDLPSRHFPVAPNWDNSEDPSNSTFADNRAHIEFCERYGLPMTVETETGDSATPRPTQTATQWGEDNGSTVAASSIYSTHPGFRRSQERLVVVEEREWAGEQSKASSSQSSRASTLRQGSSLLAMIRNNRNKMLDENEDD
ncbi:hypothetical protein FGRMN_5927 [Fusarium graminum]|nr:hypothetical protein FGRMN_5927 [Fusarium graminum]